MRCPSREPAEVAFEAALGVARHGATPANASRTHGRFDSTRTFATFAGAKLKGFDEAQKHVDKLLAKRTWSQLKIHSSMKV